MERGLRVLVVVMRLLVKGGGVVAVGLVVVEGLVVRGGVVKVNAAGSQAVGRSVSQLVSHGAPMASRRVARQTYPLAWNAAVSLASNAA